MSAACLVDSNAPPTAMECPATSNIGSSFDASPTTHTFLASIPLILRECRRPVPLLTWGSAR